jgi:hypothetical protein
MTEPATVAAMNALMERECQRKAPPPGFPRLPDLPAARYTSPAFRALGSGLNWSTR